MNDKLFGMGCVTLMFLAVVGVSMFTDKPLDPAVKEIASMIITGIMGVVVGVTYKTKVK
jgi:hypothetical protein